MTQAQINDHQIEIFIGRLLQFGVLLSATVVLIGAIVYLSHQATHQVGYHTFHGEPAGLTTVHGIVTGLAHPSGKGMIQLGLLLLIATPVTRVMFSAIAFALERDYLYVILTLIVLGVLAYSLVGSSLHL